MRLIDADALKNLPFERMIHTDFGDTAIPIEEIDNAPTVKPRDNFDLGYVQGLEDGKNDRPQGEWIFRQGVTCGGYYKCSNCGEVERAEKNFCHNCGAKMEEKQEGEK